MDTLPTQAHNLPLLATPSTTAGKTYIITGANTGLGFEAAKHLATLGAARVILGVRNPAAGQAAKLEIDTAAGLLGPDASDVVQVWPLDLCSYASVRAFAKRAGDELARIDGLVLNAAVALATREVAEGHAKPVTVNVVSTLALAVLLLPVMSGLAKKVGGGLVPRVVVVTSRVGFDAREAWEGIKGDPVRGMDAEDMDPVATYVGLSCCCRFSSFYSEFGLVGFN
jgi:NAD(P)-dependent dehydrogenase (short-subunit alcohol dehydrogenase family)